METLEKRIISAEKKFIDQRKTAPRFLLLSMVGYLELKQEVAVRTGKESLEWDDDFTFYEGMNVLVSQDQEFEEFVLAV